MPGRHCVKIEDGVTTFSKLLDSTDIYFLILCMNQLSFVFTVL